MRHRPTSTEELELILEEGAQVMVEVFDDRVEIYNPGGLPKGLTPETFGTRSVCRNPLIASLLLRCDYIEKMGTGIKRIQKALVKEKCAPVVPSFDYFFTLTFPRHVQEVESGLESGLESNTVNNVIMALQYKLLSRMEIAESLGHKQVSGAVNRSIKELLNKKLIEYSIPDKPNSRLQKYRLTDKGRALLQQIKK